MKNIIQYMFAGIALLMLTACPSEPEAPQTYKQSVVLPSNAMEQEITLNKLNSSIVTVENPATWITVETPAYTSGYVKIKVHVTANTERTERKCNITITVSSGDKVILSVTQQGSQEGTGIDDLHGAYTDKPAYRRQ